MSAPLGLSIGAANVIAARVGSAPVTRRSVLTLFDHRPPVVGAPENNPNLTEPGLVLGGFIERIGDPAPLVAPDGSMHPSNALAAEALDAMVRAAGDGSPAAIAVPAHWGQNTVAALREAMRLKPALAPDGVPPTLISDATTALAALYAKPGFPTDGVVALCDFGATGTSVTLSDAAADFRHIGETVRYSDFSGNQVDQAILNQLPDSVDGGADIEAAGTERLGVPTRRLDECRRAKEQLSAATVAVVPAERPGDFEDVRLSRTELEKLISSPLERFVTRVEEILRRNEIPTARLAAVATVGGGACIPLITRQLGERLRVPVVTTPQPALSAAIGAALLAEQRLSAEAPTALNPAATGPVDLNSAAPTEVVSSGWAARVAAGAAPTNGTRSATYRALAWSQEASTGNEPVPYTGEDHSGEYGQDLAGTPAAVTSETAGDAAPVPAPEQTRRHKSPGVMFSLAAAAALAALLGAGMVMFKMSTTKTGPFQHTTTTVTPSRLPKVGPLPPPPPTTSETPPPPASTESVIPPPSTEPPVTTTTVPTTTVPTTTVPTTTVPTPTTTWPTTTPPTTRFSYPPIYPYWPTTTPHVPPPVPVTPPYYR